MSCHLHHYFYYICTVIISVSLYHYAGIKGSISALAEYVLLYDVGQGADCPSICSSYGDYHPLHDRYNS
jgi:hypothetical protein